MTYLATALQSFFTDYVHTQRLTDNTIASYRDTWRLLIKHVCATTATSADQILLDDIDHDLVTAFLDHLSNERTNTAATRNARLIAIRVLFAHILPDHPEHAETIRRILTIPPAKTAKPMISYLSEDETDALLAAPDTTTWTGMRDQMMLALTVNTGLRISELIGLATTSIHTGTSPYIECEGKGRKHRATPISATTRDQMLDYTHGTQQPARLRTVSRPPRQRALTRRHRTPPCNPRPHCHRALPVHRCQARHDAYPQAQHRHKPPACRR